MKKTFFISIFLLMGIFVKAQIGIGFYPLGSMASIRWNPKEFVRDSSKVLYVTNYNYHLELRSTLSVTNNYRGTRVSAQPEVVFYHHLAGNPGSPNLLSGIGAALAISHNRIGSGGIFIPLVVEYVPQLNFTHSLAFNLEMDLIAMTNTSSFTARFRPLFSVSWIFPTVSAHSHS